MTFLILLERVRVEANRRIANGEFTERAFAQRVGISQPQMHNILKRARGLTPATADEILRALEMPLSELL